MEIAKIDKIRRVFALFVWNQNLQELPSEWQLNSTITIEHTMLQRNDRNGKIYDVKDLQRNDSDLKLCSK